MQSSTNSGLASRPSSSALTLLVLAAGMGSRYGGLKQVDPMGPTGETLLDYSVFDALRSGFSRVVFVIRREMQPAFAEQIGSRFLTHAAVEYVFQELDDLPNNDPSFCFHPPIARKPWGTGHAIWAARKVIQEPFVAINADDFYGKDAFAQLAQFLATAGERQFAMAGYRLANTLSEHGSVARGICEVSLAGELLRVDERTNICRDETGSLGDGNSGKLTGEETVSMNFWGFTPAVFPLLEKNFVSFLRANQGNPKAEYYIPEAVSQMIAAGDAAVQVLPTKASWFGVTYPEDKPRVVKALLELTRTGDYPTPLWTEKPKGL